MTTTASSSPFSPLLFPLSLLPPLILTLSLPFLSPLKSWPHVSLHPSLSLSLPYLRCWVALRVSPVRRASPCTTTTRLLTSTTEASASVTPENSSACAPERVSKAIRRHEALAVRVRAPLSRLSSHNLNYAKLYFIFHTVSFINAKIT